MACIGNYVETLLDNSHWFWIMHWFIVFFGLALKIER